VSRCTERVRFASPSGRGCGRVSSRKAVLGLAPGSLGIAAAGLGGARARRVAPPGLLASFAGA
jgi:hypothetical protein